MSENIRGITFAEQTVTPADDAIIRRAILGDGVLTGCEVSYSGSTLTMDSGYIIACGRAFQITAAHNWAVVDATSGFARLLLTLDLTKTATEDTFSKIAFSLEYAAAEDGFLDLVQEDINLSGAKYQIVAAVVSLGAGGITGIVSKLEKTEGGGGLNFKVVAGLTQPGSATENTIWLKTDTIAGWIIDANQPEDLTEGMVWIGAGTKGDIKFNALRRNGLQVYPEVARKYVSGLLVSVPVAIYQNGEWVNLWDGELYDSGDPYEAVTGGFVSRIGGGNGTGKITFGTSSISFATKSGAESGTIYTRNLMDLTRFTKMNVEMNVTAVNTVLSDTVSIGIASANTSQQGADLAIVKTNSKKTGAMTLECDISTVGSGYPYVCAAEANFVVTKIYLE